MIQHWDCANLGVKLPLTNSEVDASEFDNTKPGKYNIYVWCSQPAPKGADTYRRTSFTVYVVDSEPLMGDANLDGKVSIADAVAVLQHIANKDRFGLTAQGQANADVDGIAGITTNDALVIQKVDAGLIKSTDLPLKA